MSVVIKDMILPRCCSYCPLSMPTQFEERRCYITDRVVDIDPFYGRDEHCPMRECDEEVKV